MSPVARQQTIYMKSSMLNLKATCNDKHSVVATDHLPQEEFPSRNLPGQSSVILLYMASWNQISGPPLNNLKKDSC